jgi:competence protein ComEC
LATSFIPFISNIFGIITNYLLYGMDYCVSYIEKLPNSVMHFTSIFTIETILIYCIVIALLLLIYLKKKEYIYISLLFILILSVKFTLAEIDRGKQQKIIFFSAGKFSAIGFIEGKKQILIADSALIKDKKANKFQLEGTRNLYGIQSTKVCAIDTITNRQPHISRFTESLSYLGNYFLFHNKRIILLDSVPRLIGTSYRLKTDFLVIRQNPKLYINSLNKLYQAEIIIFDGSNSIYKTNKWIIDCKKAGLKSYSTKDQGAYIVDL